MKTKEIIEKNIKWITLFICLVLVIGIVENMSYFICPSCSEKHYIFGESHIEEIAAEYGIENVAKIPMDKSFADKVDKGEIEDFEGKWLENLFDAIEKIN